MLLDVYISDLCYYDLVDKDKIGELPPYEGRGPIFFPSFGSGSKHFYEVIKRIKNGQYKGRQENIWEWVAVVTKQDILVFIADMYGEKGKNYLTEYPEQEYPYIHKEFNELMAYVDALEEDKLYALVTDEF